MLNSDSFLKTFSTIEAWLRQQADADRSTTFYQLIDRVSKRNRTVERYRDDLKEFADLRNAIVHERSDGHIIAEPNDRALSDFNHLCTTLLNPPKLIPKFQLDVRSRMLTDSVGEAVSDMRKGSFSQLPVLSGNTIIALLTSETVVRWLASEVHNGLVSLWDTKIEHVLPHTEDRDHYCILARDATMLDALTRFEDFAARGKDLDAILISNDGKSDQKLLGIITLFDLPVVLGTLGFKRTLTT